MKEDGCTNVAMANDKEVYGAGLSRNIEGSLKEQGVKLAFNEGIDPKASNFRSLAARAKSAAPTASCSPASPPTARSRSTRTSPRRCRTRSCTARTASPSPASPTRRRAASRPPSEAREGTVATLNPESYPPEGQEFFKQFERSTARRTPTRTRSTATRPRLVLDAIERAGSTRQGGRPEGALRHEGSPERARHVLDRRER